MSTTVVQATLGADRRRSYEVALCVCTYRRPEALARLLRSVEALRITACPRTQIQLVVVDNDPAGSACSVPLPDDFASRYLIETRAGIAAARNRALREADARFVAFVDDDEVVDQGWLDALLVAQRTYGADAVAGPVLSEFEEPAPDWALAGGFFDRERHPSGTPISQFRTGNLLLRTSALDGYKGPFDDRLGLLGGSDTMLSRVLDRDGRRMVWCDEAIVTELVPPERVRWWWLVRRAARAANTAALVEIGFVGRRRASRAAARLVVVYAKAGARLLLLGIARREVHLLVSASRRFGSAVGTITPYFGLNVVEYRRGASARPAHDRKASRRRRRLSVRGPVG